MVALDPATALSDRPTDATFLLNAADYTDPARHTQEQARIFRRTWLYVGEATPLQQPGAIWSTTVAGIPIVITRTPAHQLKAFYNVCPHRAALLCPEGHCQRKHLVCPYHAWVYDLDGNLVGTPNAAEFGPTFERDRFPLQPIAIDVWQGFIFVAFAPDVPPLEDYLQPIPQLIAGYRPNNGVNNSQFLFQERYQAGCNWKTYHDNTLCDYHVAIAHRRTLHLVQGPVQQYRHGFDHYVNWLYTPTTARWQRENHVLANLPDSNRTGFYTFGIFPNLHLLALPNGVLAWLRITPMATDTCQVDLEVYGIPGYLGTVDQLKQEFSAFMGEDLALVESVQQGYASGSYHPGPVHPLEARILHQQQLILSFLQQPI